MTTSQNRRGSIGEQPGLTRHGFDVLLSLILMTLMTPVLVVILTGSAISLRAWPLFSQERIGRHGKQFRFVKVRTLPVDVAAYVDKHQLDPSTIPPFCRLVRRLHLDELPQLLLVLRGHMSLVGPRPEMAHLHDRMPSAFAAVRTTVRPGCTGLWQVSESCTELISDAPEYDAFYLANRSLRLDVWLLMRTVLKMTGLSRGIRLDDIPRWVAGRDRDHEVLLDRMASSADHSSELPAAS